jgi:hypothetical protein
MESTLAHNPGASNDHDFPIILNALIATLIAKACPVQPDALASSLIASAEAVGG